MNDDHMIEFEPLIVLPTTLDMLHLADYWLVMAHNIEQSMIQAAVDCRHTCTLAELYQMAQPFVLQRWSDNSQNLMHITPPSRN